MQGYNGSQLWDTAFAAQAIISTNLIEEYGPTLRKAHTFIKNSQVFFTFIVISCIISALVDKKLFSFFSWKVLEDCPGDLNKWYRHISKGAWPFSTADHGWPISDCTAEGLKVIFDEKNNLDLLIWVFMLIDIDFFSGYSISI